MDLIQEFVYKGFRTLFSADFEFGVADDEEVDLTVADPTLVIRRDGGSVVASLFMTSKMWIEANDLRKEALTEFDPGDDPQLDPSDFYTSFAVWTTRSKFESIRVLSVSVSFDSSETVRISVELRMD